MPAVTKFFNGNPVLGTVGGGIDAFAGRPGRKRWAEIETVIGRGWDNVVDAIDEIVTIPDVDEAAVGEGRGRAGRSRHPNPRKTRRSTETEADDVVIDDVDATPTSRSPMPSPTHAQGRCSAATRTSGTRSASIPCG